jgi:hypothetical protein
VHIEEPRRRDFNWWLLLLVFLGPMGWAALLAILLVSAVGAMTAHTRPGIGGFAFTPFRASLIWALRTPRRLRLGAIATLAAANVLWLHLLIGGWTAPLVALVVSTVLGFTWLTQSDPTVDAPEDRSLAAFRRAINHNLDRCHDRIADIEETLRLSALAPGPELQRHYAHALEIRAEGADLLRAARTGEELSVANRRVSFALGALEAVRADLAALAPPEQPTVSDLSEELV